MGARLTARDGGSFCRGKGDELCTLLSIFLTEGTCGKPKITVKRKGLYLTLAYPRLSFKIKTTGRRWTQSFYRLTARGKQMGPL